MGGPRASTNRRIYSGTICANERCLINLPERTDNSSGIRYCAKCYEARLVKVIMNFQSHHTWRVDFLAADARTSLGKTLRFASEQKMFDMVAATFEPADALRDLETKLVTWGRGSVHLRITPEQYVKLVSGK